VRISYLDGLRGIAILAVVLYHGFFHVSAFRYGAMGVELFFLISGFVILLTLDKCQSFGDFFARRWVRLWPGMLIATVFTLSAYAFIGKPFGASIFPGLTLIDDRWYSWLFGTNVKSLDGVYWTLYLEMRFYVIFGLTYFLFGTRAAITILVSMGLLYLGLLETGHGLGVWRWTDFRLEAWFAAGALFYLSTKGRWFFPLAVLVGALAAWVYYPSHGPRAVGMLIVLLFASAVRLQAIQSLLSHRSIVWVGAISYPLYLIHDPLLVGLGPWVGLPLSLAAAHVIAFHVEGPVRNALKSMMHVHVHQAVCTSMGPYTKIEMGENPV
jgi:peptidoglycan/LPS O-acetylase OafA/YrhL